MKTTLELQIMLAIKHCYFLEVEKEGIKEVIWHAYADGMLSETQGYSLDRLVDGASASEVADHYGVKSFTISGVIQKGNVLLLEYVENNRVLLDSLYFDLLKKIVREHHPRNPSAIESLLFSKISSLEKRLEGKEKIFREDAYVMVVEGMIKNGVPRKPTASEGILYSKIRSLERMVHGYRPKANEKELLHRYPVEKLGVAKNVINSIKKRFRFVAELTDETEEDILGLRVIGKVNLEYLKRALGFMDLHFRGSRQYVFPKADQFYAMNVSDIFPGNISNRLEAGGIMTISDLIRRIGTISPGELGGIGNYDDLMRIAKFYRIR